MNKKFYAVRVGRRPGVYTTWPACENQVKGFPGAVYKAFPTQDQARTFVEDPSSNSRIPALPPNEAIHVWVDGSCVRNGTDSLRFGWAYVILQGERELHRASGHDVPAEARRHRNVAGEIQAVLQALAWCQTRGIAEATIHFDYQGLASWVEGTWKTTTPFTRAYAERVRALDMTLTWHKVQAHTGQKYNELVDRLARDAARSASG